MIEETIARIIAENQEIVFDKKLVIRDFNIPETDNITVITGIRRCGKTHILYSLARKYSKNDVLFLDFEDERLITLNHLSNYDIIIDTYNSIFAGKKPILFFDEIQNLKNWHFYLKRLHVQGYKIYVTGSNANLISREIATFLKGRSLETTISPFSFKEFLQLKGEKINATSLLTKTAIILNQFDEYLQFGGFPEVINSDKSNKRVIAKNIYNLLFYKDLVAKYDKNDYLLKLVVNKITENITKEFSITSLSNKIIPIYKASTKTITDYFNILPEPFLTSNLYQYRVSFVIRESKRKTYLTDNSFIFLNRIITDKSRLFENLVFNHLKRIYSNLFYYKTSNNKEVDFFIDDEHKKLLIQASLSVKNIDTKNREIKALLKAMEELNIKTGFIYTYNESEKIKINTTTIIITPFWKVCLSQFSNHSKENT